jgi:murein L,D-transpeptidase YcbB/YkuD
MGARRNALGFLMAAAGAVAVVGEGACSRRDRTTEDVAHQIRRYIEDPAAGSLRRSPVWADVRRFYERRDFRPAWFRGTRPRETWDQLERGISRAPQQGLDGTAYGIAALDRRRAEGHKDVFGRERFEPKAAAEIDAGLTQSFLLYASHLLNGVRDAGGAPPADDLDLADVLDGASQSGAIERALDDLLPRDRRYRRLAEALTRTQEEGDRRILGLNLDRWRQLPRDPGPRHMIVNIPAGELQVFEDGKETLKMRVVVGRPDSPTPAFSDTITRIVFGPAGDVLGRIKFVLSSHEDVYLHDTPYAESFERKQRTFSRGCVRVEKPVDVALHLLRDQPSWTREAIEKALVSGEAVALLTRPMPVYMVQWTAWVDEKGAVQRAPDVYGCDRRARDSAGEAARIPPWTSQRVPGDILTGAARRRLAEALRNARDEEERRILGLNLERAHALPRDPGPRYLLVNIPTYELRLVEDGQDVLDMRVVVGRPESQTPALSNAITHIVFNPTWNVPPHMLRVEILPMLREDAAHLAELGLELVSLAGKVVSLDKVDLGRPGGFHVRQPPGPGNVMGRIKFVLPNAYNVYLHDTPYAASFDDTQRTFSHGCVRVEKPVELAQRLLGDQSRWTPDTIERAQFARERLVALHRPMPVYIVYRTAWVDEDGTVQRVDDVYGRDGKAPSLVKVAASVPQPPPGH